MINNLINIIGRGPSFPYNQSMSNGLAYTENIDRINHSLFIILSTPKGSRLMMPEFGSNIHRYRFDPLDRVLLEKLRFSITEDIGRWEPRISLTSIEFLTKDEYVNNNILYVSISYNIISTNESANYVFPYKLESYDTLQASYK